VLNHTRPDLTVLLIDILYIETKMESEQTDIWVVLFVTFTAATIITVLRLLSRRLKRNSLSWDDYFALCGYVRICYCVDL